jgi:S-adenosylmethionine/arginine decarboxylase-like enzyme
MSYWGYHLILDCSNCDYDSITNPEVIKSFSETLVREIEMVPYGEPQILHFGHNSDHLTGWTLLQFIETSNIMAHFCDYSKEGYIDIFSCKEYNQDIAIDVVKRFFNPTKIRKTFLTRQAD